MSKPQRLDIKVSVVFTLPGKINMEEGIYDLGTREEAIKDILEEVKRRIEENVPAWGRCTPIIGHKLLKGQLND